MRTRRRITFDVHRPPDEVADLAEPVEDVIAQLEKLRAVLGTSPLDPDLVFHLAADAALLAEEIKIRAYSVHDLAAVVDFDLIRGGKA